IAAAVDVSGKLGRVVVKRHGSLASWLEVSLIGSPLRVCQKLPDHNPYDNSSCRSAHGSGSASLRKNALHRHFISPLADQFTIRLTDRPNPPLQVEQAQRIDVMVVLAQRRIPVNLIDETEPGESDNGHAVVLEAQD